MPNELILQNNKLIEIFIKEMKEYINQVWKNYEGFDTLDSYNLEELSKILGNFPSEAGYLLLDELFIGPDRPIHILSENSKKLLHKYYGVKLIQL